MADGLRATAHRHPAVFPLLLQRPASTSGSTEVRQAIYTALAAAGVPADRIPRVERLISSAIFGFLASETGGRFTRHPRAVLSEDYLELQDVLMAFVISQAGR